MRRSEKIWGWVMIAPLVIGIVMFLLVPLLYSVYAAFSDYDLINAPKFTGFDNIRRLLGDSYFWKSLGKSFINAIGVPFSIGLGLLVALMSNSIKRGTKLFRTMFFLPAVCSSVAVTFMWKYMLDYTNGVVNWFIAQMGMERIKFFSPEVAMTSMIIMGVWGSIGIISILYYAALKNVPAHYYEAAIIDGAGSWAKFRYITLPMISPITLYILITQLIGALQDSTRFMVMSGNGNAEELTTAGVYVYKQTFEYGSPGYASTVAWALGTIIIGITVVNFVASRKWVSYDT